MKGLDLTDDKPNPIPVVPKPKPASTPTTSTPTPNTGLAAYNRAAALSNAPKDSNNPVNPMSNNVYWSRPGHLNAAGLAKFGSGAGRGAGGKKDSAPQIQFPITTLRTVKTRPTNTTKSKFTFRYAEYYVNESKLSTYGNALHAKAEEQGWFFCCDRCNAMKKRCNHQFPCELCVFANAVCRYAFCYNPYCKRGKLPYPLLTGMYADHTQSLQSAAIVCIPLIRSLRSCSRSF